MSGHSGISAVNNVVSIFCGIKPHLNIIPTVVNLHLIVRAVRHIPRVSTESKAAAIIIIGVSVGAVAFAVAVEGVSSCVGRKHLFNLLSFIYWYYSIFLFICQVIERIYFSARARSYIIYCAQARKSAVWWWRLIGEREGG